jgi:hypothetical protein
MSNLIKRAVVFCIFVAAAMIVAVPATTQTQKKAETKEVKKEGTKASGCCADKKSADAKACADDAACCADGKEGKHTKAEHEKMEKKDDGKKDDGR